MVAEHGDSQYEVISFQRTTSSVNVVFSRILLRGRGRENDL
jgi:hypothetical protein